MTLSENKYHKKILKTWSQKLDPFFSSLFDFSEHISSINLGTLWFPLDLKAKQMFVFVRETSYYEPRMYYFSIAVDWDLLILEWTFL